MKLVDVRCWNGFKVIVETNLPSEGVRAAMIADNGAAVELMEFEQ